MIEYVDCPGCGAARIRSGVSQCSVCETWRRAEKQMADAVERVRAEEREACAKLAWEEFAGSKRNSFERETGARIAMAIEGRGQAAPPEPKRAHEFTGISEQCSRCGAWRPGGWAAVPESGCPNPEHSFDVCHAETTDCAPKDDARAKALAALNGLLGAEPAMGDLCRGGCRPGVNQHEPDCPVAVARDAIRALEGT